MIKAFIKTQNVNAFGHIEGPACNINNVRNLCYGPYPNRKYLKLWQLL